MASCDSLLSTVYFVRLQLTAPMWGPTTIWHITLEGTDAQGQAVHVAVQAELPWIPPKEGGAIDANQGPGSELPAIDFTVPRLYFPHFSGSE